MKSCFRLLNNMLVEWRRIVLIDDRVGDCCIPKKSPIGFYVSRIEIIMAKIVAIYFLHVNTTKSFLG